MNTQLYFLRIEKDSKGKDIGFISRVLHIYDKSSLLGKSCDQWGNSRGGAPAYYVDTGWSEELSEERMGQFFDSLQDLQQFVSECDIRLLSDLV